ncbi:MAG: hypothetical protein BMS9Abin05_1498 [Rhodothermia bacterium]|nr:MAG: hypothetical protein BMS9Abin05_1498 [Rhodothermia bacterium]
MIASQTTILEVHPVISAKNMEESICFYQDKLGFTLKFSHAAVPGDPVDYAGLERGAFSLHLQAMVPGQDDAMPLIRVRVENIEPLHEEHVAKGVVAETGQLEPKPWGTKEFGLYDHNGAAIVFYEDFQ